MAISSWNAGIIRPVAVAPAGPYQDGAAPGVWTLDQQAFWQKQGLWPIAGNAAPIALFAGGSGPSNVIDKILTTTLGNSIDYGDLSVAREGVTGCGSNTVAIFAGGTVGSTENLTIDSKNYSSSGNCAVFGNLTQARYFLEGL